MPIPPRPVSELLVEIAVVDDDLAWCCEEVARIAERGGCARAHAAAGALASAQRRTLAGEAG